MTIQFFILIYEYGKSMTFSPKNSLSMRTVTAVSAFTSFNLGNRLSSTPAGPKYPKMKIQQ